MLGRVRLKRKILAGTMLALLAGCQTPAPTPSAPPVAYTPRAPVPPLGASINTYIPPVRADGLRQTINRDIGPLQTLWHVRSALNVAALGCNGVGHERLVDDYNLFIGKNSSALRNANNAILRKFQRDHGRGYRTEHDRQMTALYNYWSFSPVRRNFCDTAVTISQQAVEVPSSGLNNFAASALPQLEKPFNDFYLAYEQYERDLDAWRAKYAPEQLRDARDETINPTGLTGGLSEEAQEVQDDAIVQPLPGDGGS